MVLIVCPYRPAREEIDVSARQRRDYGLPMANNTYRVSEIIGTSPESIDAAIKSGVARAQQTIRNLDWFEVTEIRGHIADGQIAHYQVGMKVGFRLDASE
jgi:dodecin